MSHDVFLCSIVGGISEACFVESIYSALAGMVLWIECQPANLRVPSSTPSQGTCLGRGPGLQQGALERQPHTDVSVPLFLSLPYL